MRATNNQLDAFRYAYLTMASGCIYYLFGFVGGAYTAEKAGDTVAYQAVWLVLYLVLIFKLAKLAPIVWPLFLSSGFLIGLITSAALSLIIGEADNAALIKFGMYLMTIAFAAWLSARKDAVDQIFDSLYWLGIVVLFLHILAYPLGTSINWDPLFRPTLLGTEPYAGLFGHKNIAGNFFGIIALVYFAKILSPLCKNRPSCFLLFALSVAMVVISGSISSLVGVVLSATLILFSLVARWERVIVTLFWMVATIIALFLTLLGSSFFFEQIGRSANLTGRGLLWSAGMFFFWQRPLLGYGYANFFESPVRADQLGSMMPYHVMTWSFDNSYLEILLRFGVIGGFFFGVILLRAIWTSFRFLSTQTSTYNVGPLALVFFALTTGLAESFLVLHNYLICVIIFWAYFGLQPTKQTNSVRVRRVPRRISQLQRARPNVGA